MSLLFVIEQYKTYIFVYFLGDGGEDVSCVLEDYHLDVTRDDNGQFDSSYVETFLDELKIFFVGGLVYPRLHMSQRYFDFNITCYHCYAITLLLPGFQWT